MRILLSAYACEPNKGSEPGVGWNWALALVRRGHQVWVITRANNQASIEQALMALGEPYVSKLHFIYYDLPSWATWWKKGRRGVHLYYLLWQWGAYLCAKHVHKDQNFNLVHHVTFVSVRQPSFMGNLGIPFVFGPVAGGETIPTQLRRELSRSNKLKECVRDIANLLVQFDPMMVRTFAQAERIYVTSEQTLALIPQKYKSKSSVQLAIAVDEKKSTEQMQITQDSNIFRVLYVGHFLNLKGMQLGLEAYAKLLKSLPSAHLTMVGQGEEEINWRILSIQLGIEDGQISWIPWVSQNELTAYYSSHDLFLFPSLRDSGGMVVLEAFNSSLPTICLKLGGPGVIVDNSCGRVIEVENIHREIIVTRLAEAMVELANNPLLMKKLREGARAKAKASSWDAIASRVYEHDK